MNFETFDFFDFFFTNLTIILSHLFEGSSSKTNRKIISFMKITTVQLDKFRYISAFY